MDTAPVNPSLAAAIMPINNVLAVDLVTDLELSRTGSKKRYHNKSRNGCRTCKTRRVKCDESRPNCQRCRTFRCHCDGYDELFQPKPKISRGEVFLINRRARVVPQVQPTKTFLCRSPQQSIFKNDQEQRYFSLFSSKTANQLTGLFPTDLWDRLVLQVSEHDSSVRHAIIAVRALDAQTWKSPTKSWKDILRRKFAYHEYSIAIIEMRKAISLKTLDLRTRLIACLVFIAFEVYHRNAQSAVAQIENMSLLIKEKLRDQNIYIPTSLGIDDELLETFRDLEIQNLISNTFGRALTQRDLLHSRQTIRKEIPQEFVSLHQARVMFHIIVMRQLYWQNTCKHEWPWWITPQTISLFKLNNPLPNEHTTTEEWYAERDRRFEEYIAWWNAFQPLLLKAQVSHDHRELRCAEIVRMSYLAAYLAFMTRMLSPWEAWYGQAARLAELMALIKHLLETTEDTGFCVEMNFLIPLIVIAKLFRHRVLRQEAIRVMLAYPRREGLWDGVLVAKSLQWIAEIEEDGMGDEEEYVPHYLATDLVRGLTEVDPVKRSAKLVAYQRPRNALMTVIRRETVVTW